MESSRPEEGKWDWNQDSSWRSVLETAFLLFVCVTLSTVIHNADCGIISSNKETVT